MLYLVNAGIFGELDCCVHAFSLGLEFPRKSIAPYCFLFLWAFCVVSNCSLHQPSKFICLVFIRGSEGRSIALQFVTSNQSSFVIVAYWFYWQSPELNQASTIKRISEESLSILTLLSMSVCLSVFLSHLLSLPLPLCPPFCPLINVRKGWKQDETPWNNMLKTFKLQKLRF